MQLHHLSTLASLDLDAFQFTRSLNSAVDGSLQGVNPLTYALVLTAGLASSLSPCTLSVMPLTIGYIGGYTEAQQQGPSALVRALAFGTGVASTLTLLGLVSTSIGAAYGQTGTGSWIPIGAASATLHMTAVCTLHLCTSPSATLTALPPCILTRCFREVLLVHTTYVRSCGHLCARAVSGSSHVGAC